MTNDRNMKIQIISAVKQLINIIKNKVNIPDILQGLELMYLATIGIENNRHVAFFNFSVGKISSGRNTDIQTCVNSKHNKVTVNT